MPRQELEFDPLDRSYAVNPGDSDPYFDSPDHIDDGPSVLPLPQRVIYVGNPVFEETERELLLTSVTIDENGIAHSIDPISKTDTMLAAVQISKDGHATLVPFQQGERAIFMDLPEEGARIGFFVGTSVGNTNYSAVIRQGEFPNIPLVTESTHRRGTVREILLNMQGIDHTQGESDHERWAEQVGLFDILGFQRERTRGIFSRSQRIGSSDEWLDQPILAVPPSEVGAVAHYDRFEVQKDCFQIQTYPIREVRQSMLVQPSAFDPFDEKPVMKGLHIAYGEPTQNTAQTTRVQRGPVASAFQVRIRPRK